MEKGKVYLIGAGPGDPGLLTVKGLACLQEAEVVIYDYLANERILNSTRAGAEIIYAGKKGGDHALPQEQINSLITAKAREGKTVARLKGGDPFIFGRGGEEAEELARAGIPFEIVPGVTSAIAAPAYAGIPLTHRAYTSTVAFITGHEDPEKEESQIAWDKISTGAGTLVFLMAVGNLSRIAAELMRHGRSPKTPAALIRWGTLPEQETYVADLDSIGALAERQRVKPPAILLVGEVVGLREKLNWFETLPLLGKKIIVTRSREQASDLAERLRRLGADPVEFPTIEILPPENYADLDHCLTRLAGYDWVLFTSANGVRFFLARLLESGRDIRDLKGPRIAAIGPKTREELENLKIRVDFVPAEYRAEALFAGLKKEDLAGKRILIPRAKMARDILPRELRKAGAKVEVVEAYRTHRPERGAEKVREMLEERKIAAVTFTSSSTVSNFVELLGAETASKLLKNTVCASIGPVTAETAGRFGIDSAVVPKDYTIPALVDALVSFFHGCRRSGGGE